MRELCRFDVQDRSTSKLFFCGQLAQRWRKSPFGGGQPKKGGGYKSVACRRILKP